MEKTYSLFQERDALVGREVLFLYLLFKKQREYVR